MGRKPSLGAGLARVRTQSDPTFIKPPATHPFGRLPSFGSGALAADIAALAPVATRAAQRG
tara:strand:+ start:2589 stop:2771 length:183 start_codon:yes stop_codon:yes gene_type:complete